MKNIEVTLMSVIKITGIFHAVKNIEIKRGNGIYIFHLLKILKLL